MKPTSNLLSVLSILSVLMVSACDKSKDLPPQLQVKAACMMRVLKAIPGVTSPKLRAVTRNGITYVSIEYLAAESARWETPTTFALDQESNGEIVASTTLPGLFTPGTQLDLHVTNAVKHAWQAQCSVPAMVMTV
jgi:hypothetical protein